MNYLHPILFFLSVFVSTGMMCQVKPNLVLQQKLKEVSFLEKEHNLLVRADKKQIIKWMELNGGKLKYESGEWFSIRIKGKKIEKLLALKWVWEVGFENYTGMVLNDHVAQNANVSGLQTGWQFDSSLTGKGVLVGFIDAGIDYTHSDFIDENGNSRILYIWDQNPPADSTLIFEDYGYGHLYTSDTLNSWLGSGIEVPLDPSSLFGHGSTVAGAVASNGRALHDELIQGTVLSDLHGIAGESKIIMVSSDFNSENWLATVADGVDFMLNKAEDLNMPVIINLSVGTYLGSHDALDPVGSIINNWFSDNYTGRMLVCAAGNSGQLRYHLGYHSTLDTSVSVFKIQTGLSTSGKGSRFEVWLDSLNASDFSINIGFTDVQSGGIIAATYHGSISENMDSVLVDTLFAGGEYLGIINQYIEARGDQYRLQVQVDSVVVNNINTIFLTSGMGRVDSWSAAWLGTSDILGSEQVPTGFGDNFKSPDSLMQTVSSFSCAPNVITVANYRNRSQYTDVNGSVVDFEVEPGSRTPGSSRGPTRDGRLKPDISASGDLVLSTGAYNVIDDLLAAAPFKVALGGKHIRNGGTSMASPIVAGVATLYLQHCPNSFPSEIKQDIIGASFQDIFTGSLPNYRWGNGKLNGLAAVNATLFDVEITATESIECPAGQLLLSTQNNYFYYRWNTGDTLAQICGSPGQYQVTVSDNSGCWSISQPFDVVVLGTEEISKKPILIYPNPIANNEFVISGLAGKNEFRIINALGQKIDFQTSEDGFLIKVKLIDPKPGIYFVLFEERTKAKKIIIK